METTVHEEAFALFEMQLEDWLTEKETEQTLAAVAAECPKVTVETVRAKVLDKWEDVEMRLEPAQEGWRKASERLTEAEVGVESQVSASRLRWVGRLTIAVVLLAAGGVVVLGAAVDAAFLFLLYFVALLIPLPWLNLWSERRVATSELSLPLRTKALERSEKRFRAALKEQVAVAIREVVNADITSFEKGFRIFDQRGLRELTDPEREVSTRSSGALKRLLTSLDSGSIGLAGPRGAGKTTLITSFAKGRSMPFEKERTGLVVSAPVKYDAREFVLHLFSSLCKEVIGEDGLDEMSQLSWGSLGRRRRALLAQLAMYVGGVLMIAAGAMLVFHRTSPKGPTETGGTLLILGFAVAYIAFMVRGSNDPRFARRVNAFLTWAMHMDKSKSKPRPKRSPEQVAGERLEEIGFQQSVSSGVSGGLKLPLGMSLGGESATTMSRRPWSMPEAVDEFRRFASTQFEDRYLVIGIDELDKMESDEAAREFLNDVKGVFGVNGCYYLVSVSEDAMSTFERRGLPFRDVFDSSFDAIQQIRYLTLAESRLVLESRVTGLPVPFQCLCHCLAGGLPRDLIRVTRNLVDIATNPAEPDSSSLTEEKVQPPPRTLGRLCTALVRAEHRGKMEAAIAASRATTGDRRDWLVQWLDKQQSGSVDPANLRDWTADLAQWSGLRELIWEDDRARRAREIAVEIATFNYYAATMLEFFGLSYVDLLLRKGAKNELDPLGGFAVERLGVARQHFVVSPRLAWATIDRVRGMTRREPWEDPRGAPAR